MQIVIPDLYASAPAGLSFAPTMHIHAFLLRRRHGNLLVFSAGTVADDARAIEDLGGISRHYVNHWHEAAFGGGERVASTFGAPLFCHENERELVTETTKVAGTFSSRHMQDDDFEVIPIPGHTGVRGGWARGLISWDFSRSCEGGFRACVYAAGGSGRARTPPAAA